MLKLGQKITMAAVGLVGMVPSVVFMGIGTAGVGAAALAANYADDAALLGARLLANSQFLTVAVGAAGSAVICVVFTIMNIFCSNPSTQVLCDWRRASYHRKKGYYLTFLFLISLFFRHLHILFRDCIRSLSTSVSW
jgi:hypothetical protein